MNPNQCRAYCISACYDPTDGHWALGVDTEEDSIPMGMKETTCTFATWCTMDEEFQQCFQILFRDQDHWYSSTKIFQISVVEEYIRYIIIFYRGDLRQH